MGEIEGSSICDYCEVDAPFSDNCETCDAVKHEYDQERAKRCEGIDMFVRLAESG